MAKNDFTGELSRQEIVITRVFNAPRELVWQAWTAPRHFQQWWGPRDFTCPFCEMDFRVGGRYLYCMRSPDGKDYWGTGVFQDIVPLERIAFTDSFADEKGNVVPGTHYGMSPDFPVEMLVVVTFEDLQGKTKMTLRHIGVPTGPDGEGTQQGWSESFDKLAKNLGDEKRNSL
jgi:uncharacterized protein YndB with AHSA1/START domain